MRVIQNKAHDCTSLNFISIPECPGRFVALRIAIFDVFSSKNKFAHSPLVKGHMLGNVSYHLVLISSKRSRKRMRVNRFRHIQLPNKNPEPMLFSSKRNIVDIAGHLLFSLLRHFVQSQAEYRFGSAKFCSRSTKYRSRQAKYRSKQAIYRHHSLLHNTVYLHCRCWFMVFTNKIANTNTKRTVIS